MIFPLSVVLNAVLINFKKVEKNSLKTDKHFSRGKNEGKKKINVTCHFAFPAQQRKATTVQNKLMALRCLHKKKLYVLHTNHFILKE